ncbi:AAA family ATPase [Puniceicoccus vermicola]|uniref:AAA family ATPase n=1 Tax=Puniceicoccus vermicola TaxID=388746 RepID=A0A7X1AW36_9BACT|nr:AAA family ATPase [Puniceicoccus vermicola]
MISAPKNTTTKRIFVAATRQNQGKTTTSLGLFGGMKKFSPHVGYIKPIGQRFVQIEGQKIDEDSVLFDSVYDLDVPIGAISPVAIDGRMTRWYLDNPGRKLEHLIDLICRAFDRAAFNKDYIIIEGSGHAGVGSVFDLSNAAIARILGAKAIIVSEGGIGSPVDEIAMNKALFDQFGVEVIGAIINKVLPEKLDLIREYAGKGLERLGIPLLGCLPLRKRLQAPTFSQVVKEINGRWLNGAEHGMTERILRVVIGAMTAKGVVDYIQPGVLIITPGDREDVLFSAIASANISKKQVVSGIILTRNILPHPKLMDLISMTEIPVVICSEESYTVASKINNMTVKTQPTDEDKIPIIQEIVAEHTDMERIRDAFTEGKPNRK